MRVLRRLGRLKSVREEKFLSVRELAAKAGVAASTVVDAELGRSFPHPATIRKLAEALEVRPGRLVGPFEGDEEEDEEVDGGPAKQAPDGVSRLLEEARRFGEVVERRSQRMGRG